MPDWEDRFWEKVDVGGEGECWEWQAALADGRYGHFWKEGKLELAHRVSYQLEYGDIVDGPNVLHTCDNPRCVNPDHLYPGDQSDNAKDMWERDRHPGPGHGGESNPSAKLSEDEVVEIRERLEGGDSQRAVADDYGISQGHVSDIATRKKWPGV